MKPWGKDPELRMSREERRNRKGVPASHQPDYDEREYVPADAEAATVATDQAEPPNLDEEEPQS